jgi:predicted nucleotidyltransferase component of viral defense system
MSDRLIRQTAEAAEPVHRLNAVKELLQGSILIGLAKDGLLSQVAFHGGTALRLVHGLRRYSEDLDFIRMATEIDPRAFTASISRTLTKHDLFPRIGHSRSMAANSNSKELLKISIAALSDNKLRELINAPQVQISLEIDLNPPEHVETERLNTKHRLALPVFTLPSLMSGKLHILLTRRDREKGRDWYDYAWYRQQGITPNLPQLQSAIDQTSGGVRAERWADLLREIIPTKNWSRLRDDVRPFLERSSDLDDLTEANILELTPEPAGEGDSEQADVPNNPN